MNKETLRMQMLAGVITEGQYKEKLQEGIFQNLLGKLKGNKKPEPVEKSELDGLTDEQAQTLYDEYMKQASSIDPYDPTHGGWSTAAETIAFKIKRMYPNVKELPTKNESLNEHFVAGGIVGIGAINQIPSRAKTDYEDAFEYFLGQKYNLNEAENVEAIGDKVTAAVEDKLEVTVDKLSDEEKDKLRAELAKIGVTATSNVKDVAGKLDESLYEAEEDTKTKLANAFSDIGGGLMKSMLVPLIPLIAGQATGTGFAGGLAITTLTAGALIALAKALGAEKSMEEGKEVEEEYNY